MAPLVLSLGHCEQALEGNAGPVRAVPELVAHLVDLEEGEERADLLQRLIEARGACDFVVRGGEGAARLLLPGVKLRLPAAAVVADLQRVALERGVARISEGAQHSGYVGQRGVLEAALRERASRLSLEVH